MRVKDTGRSRVMNTQQTIPVVVQPAAWFCGLSFFGIVGSNLARRNGCVSFVNVVSSGRGLCDGPIPRPEESYSMCVCVHMFGRACY